jgi:hypothetical protein
MNNILIIGAIVLIALYMFKDNMEGFRGRWGRRWRYRKPWGRYNRFGRYRWGRRWWGPRRWRRRRWRTIPHYMYGPYYRRAYDHWNNYWRWYNIPYKTWYYDYFINYPNYYIPDLNIPADVGYYPNYTVPKDKPDEKEPVIVKQPKANPNTETNRMFFFGILVLILVMFLMNKQP